MQASKVGKQKLGQKSNPRIPIACIFTFKGEKESYTTPTLPNMNCLSPPRTETVRQRLCKSFIFSETACLQPFWIGKQHILCRGGHGSWKDAASLQIDEFMKIELQNQRRKSFAMIKFLKKSCFLCCDFVEVSFCFQLQIKTLPYIYLANLINFF